MQHPPIKDIPENTLKHNVAKYLQRQIADYFNHIIIISNFSANLNTA